MGSAWGRPRSSPAPSSSPLSPRPWARVGTDGSGGRLGVSCSHQPELILGAGAGDSQQVTPRRSRRVKVRSRTEGKGCRADRPGVDPGFAPRCVPLVTLSVFSAPGCPFPRIGSSSFLPSRALQAFKERGCIQCLAQCLSAVGCQDADCNRIGNIMAARG